MKRRGFLLAMALLILPIAALMIFSVSRLVLTEAGMSSQAQKKMRAFYVCQAGMAAAYHAFGANNYNAVTHDTDGSSIIPSGDPKLLDPYNEPFLSRQADGWFHWQWNPGDPPASSFTQSGQGEEYRFQIYFPDPGHWRIVCEGRVGAVVSRQEQWGQLRSAYEFVDFDNGDTSDFNMAEVHQVIGPIHSNGNMYLRPWTTGGFSLGPLVLVHPVTPAQLNIQSNSVTSAGKIIRYEDAWQRQDPGGTVSITKGSSAGPLVIMEGRDQGAVGAGNAYDSDHPQWKDPTSGAIPKWGGTVADGQLGVKKLSVPLRDALLPGGYYDRKSSTPPNIKIVPSDADNAWMHSKTFYNQAEDRQVTVKEIDVAAMQAAGAYPANGIIYSTAPLRIVNAAKLPAPITISSDQTIYTKSDFNMDNPDGTGIGQKVSASLVTSDRVYNLTSSFDDTESYTFRNPVLDPPAEASDAARYAGDPDNVVEVNAAIVDGQPTTNVRAWDNTPGNPYRVAGTYVNPLTGEDTGAKAVTTQSILGITAPLKIAYPNSMGYLENLQACRVVQNGSIVHLRTAKMAQYDNSDADPTSPTYDPTVMPWLTKSYYIPPYVDPSSGLITRKQIHDPMLVTSPPPLTPFTSRKLLWRVLN